MNDANLSKALALHDKSIVVLAHCDSVIYWSPKPTLSQLYYPIVPWPEDRSLGQRSKFGHLDLPRMIEGKVNCCIFAIRVTRFYNPERCVKRALELFDSFYKEVDENSNKIALAVDYKDIVKVTSEHKVAAMLSIEGGEAIEGNLAVLRTFYKLGIRIFGLTHNDRNQIADGIGEGTKGGLTKFGFQVINELDRLGIVIDVSHLSDQGFWDVVGATKNPIIASHSNTRSVCNHSRNLTDDQIKSIAEKGGVIGINLAPETIDAMQPSLSKLVDHIDHISCITSTDTIGIGADFDGLEKLPLGIKDVSETPHITAELLNRGYSETDVKKILGDNFLRVFKKVLK